MTKRDDFVEKMKTQLDGWNADLEKLEAKFSQASEPARKRLEPQLAKLREGYAGARQKLRDAKAASEDSWDELSGDIEHVWKTLKQSINYFKSQL